MHVKRLIAALSHRLGIAASPAGAEDAALRLAVPQAFIDNGLTTHLLPGFRFRTRVLVEPVAGGEADMALVVGGGAPVFREAEGAAFGLEIRTGDADRAGRAAAFLDGLEGDAGRAAIAAFEIAGTQPFVPGAAVAETGAAVEVEGDADLGGRRALQHCGRCHVVDSRNPFGGIASTPSLPALRSRPDRLPRFAAFGICNPHPAFTQTEGVTPRFHPERPSPTAPLVPSTDEAASVAAFVATPAPRDLGAAVEAR